MHKILYLFGHILSIKCLDKTLAVDAASTNCFCAAVEVLSCRCSFVGRGDSAMDAIIGELQDHLKVRIGRELGDTLDPVCAIVKVVQDVRVGALFSGIGVFLRLCDIFH